ncbi:uncharacterized protein LOC116105694 [Pistacia vera]|uniref:uncharacterized protein LOC116105694 n=1 Tax=Pistacia vera TaxID=55513 RepID=UPI00126306FB|nr:uncharacterized protein LOC116105694 [Pistacia vera]
MVNPSKPTDGLNNSNELLNQSTNRTTSALTTSLQVINPKLTQSNYRFWSSQVLSTIGLHELEDHLLANTSQQPSLHYESSPLPQHNSHFHYNAPQFNSGVVLSTNNATVNGFGVPRQQFALTTSLTPPDPIWYMDSGATDHVTSNLNHLNFSKNYSGKDQLQVRSASTNTSALASQGLQYKSIHCRNPFVLVKSSTSFVSAEPDVQGHFDASFMLVKSNVQGQCDLNKNCSNPISYIESDTINQYVSSKNNDDVVHNSNIGQCISSLNNKTSGSDKCTAQTHTFDSCSVFANINACIFTAENCIAHTLTIAPHCLTASSSIATDPFAVNITPDNHVSDDTTIGKNSSPLNSSSFNPNTYSPLLLASTNCNSPSSPNVTPLPPINTSLDQCPLPCNKPGSSENTTAINPKIEAAIPTRFADCSLIPCPLVVDLTSSQFAAALAGSSLELESTKLIEAEPTTVFEALKLNKALYGLKQPLRAWFDKLKAVLQLKGFQNSVLDSSLFTLQQNSSYIYVLVYVDNILISGSDEAFIAQLMNDLNDHFALNTFGSLKYFLRLEATRNSNGIYLKQSKYASDLLIKTKMMEALACSTPMDVGVKLSSTDSELF